MGNMNSLLPLQELQKRFALIDLGGEIRLVDLDGINTLLSGKSQTGPTFYKRADGELLLKRFLEALPFASSPKDVIRDFWSSPNTSMYTGTAFTPKPTSLDLLNFWVGAAPTPKAGNWVKLRDFINDIVCAGDAKTFDYVIQYMAHAIQRPEEKPGVLLALLGGQGIGKGMFFRIWRAIWPRTTLLVSDVDRVIGKFNACLEHNYIICMDEALFAGNKQQIDRLKSLITEPHIQIEQKYQPERAIDSVHRLLASSNHEHFASIDNDDRRFVFLRVSEAKKQDTVYFSDIAAAVENPSTMSAMVYYLLRKDLSKFDVRRKPSSRENIKQKLQSLQGFDRFWYEVLLSGDLSGGVNNTTYGLNNASKEWTQSMFVPTAELINRYTCFNKNAQKHQTVQAAVIAEAIQRLCQSAQPSRQKCSSGSIGLSGQHRGQILPDITTARKDFERFIGGQADWT